MLVTEEVISKILLGLDVNKACGPDNMRNIFLKNLPRLAIFLKLVFQTCLNKGVFPEEWKNSEVTPIFKENNKTGVTQYRPISLLANVSNVFEKLIFNQMYLHFEPSFHRAQYGFMHQKLAVLKLLIFVDNIYKTLDQNKSSDINSL